MTSKAAPGRFVVLEGLDGAGTTTQCERIAAVLREQGIQVLTTREPSDGPIGTLIRQALTHRLTLPGGRPLRDDTLALLFAADRTDHLASRVEPALARGEWVLSDRYLLSSLAYQGSTLPMSWVEAINGRARLPDLTLFLEVDPKVAAARRAGRGGAPELFEADAQQRRISKQYRLALRLRSSKEALATLDGTRPVDEVTAEAVKHLKGFFKPKSRRAGA